MTHEQAWALIDKLYNAAGALSDVQHLNDGALSDTTNKWINTAKTDIFAVIEQLDPRK